MLKKCETDKEKSNIGLIKLMKYCTIWFKFSQVR